MESKTPKKLLAETLEDLTKENFQKFVQDLVDRRQEPRVRRCRVEDKNFLVVADVMVSTFTEKKALSVAAEILRGIQCAAEAQQLLKEAGISSSSGSVTAAAEAKLKYRQEDKKWGAGKLRDPWNNNYSKEFVQKFKMQLIKKVGDPDPLFDLLLHHKVLSDHSYSEIKALSTDEKKMSKLLMGPYLEAKPACDIFYDFLKKEQPYLVIDLLQK